MIMYFILVGDIFDSNEAPTCAKIVPCNLELQYEIQASTPASNTECSLLSVCDPYQRQFQLTPKTGTSDRICEVATECTFETHYEFALFTDTSDTQCQELSQCTAVQYTSKRSGRTFDRSCEDLRTCKETEYVSNPATRFSDRGCTTRALCKLPGFYDRQTDPKKDSICTATTPCSFSEYMTSGPRVSTDRICTALTACEGETPVITKQQTATTDRTCGIGAAAAAAAADASCSSVQYYQRSTNTCHSFLRSVPLASSNPSPQSQILRLTIPCVVICPIASVNRLPPALKLSSRAHPRPHLPIAPAMSLWFVRTSSTSFQSQPPRATGSVRRILCVISTRSFRLHQGPQ